MSNSQLRQKISSLETKLKASEEEKQRIKKVRVCVYECVYARQRVCARVCARESVRVHASVCVRTCMRAHLLENVELYTLAI